MKDWLDGIPKAELHLHLEGAIPLDTLWELIGKYGGDRAVPDRRSLDELFTYRNFDHFIETWLWKNGFLREYEDFTLIAEGAARDLARQKIRYAEVFFSPGDFERHGLEVQRLAQSIRTGLSRAPGVEIALIVDLVRDFGPKRGARTLALCSEIKKDLGVIGIGIGGTERDFPPEPYAALFAEARRLGFGTTVHAGEAAGPESVRGAVRSLEPDRIGHGTRAAEDSALVDLLARTKIPLEMCPLSNVMTGVVPSLSDHPIGRFRERGVRVTVNTDDPAMFGNSLAGELLALHRELGFTRDDIRTLILESLRSSWLDDAAKKKMIEEFKEDPAWKEEE